MTFKELRRASGMNMTQFSKYFGIPYRTIQNWELGTRQCPEYLLDLMKYKLDHEKHGHWIQPSPMFNPKCSVCGKYNDCETKSFFCTNCGAKMDE